LLETGVFRTIQPLSVREQATDVVEGAKSLPTRCGAGAAWSFAYL
jgi:hypothetical protein